MHRLLHRTLLFAPLGLGALTGGAQTTSVLFIGNSYTYVNDLPNTFRQLALSLGDTVVVGSSAPGGYTFQAHVSYGPTLAAIHSAPWNYVVLQEQSQLPSFPPDQVASECYPFAAQLVDTVLANDACTQPVFYMTWGRQNGDADNCPFWPPVCTYEGMQQQLRESYLQMAHDNAAFASPVGMAWKHVRETHPSIVLYNADQSHPSPEGTYLAACVFYSTLFRAGSQGATFTSTIDPDTAAILRTIASSTVLDSLGTWNIGVNDPDAGFDVVPVVDICAFNFTSPAEGTHAWDFGDGTTSSEAAPFHFFGSGTPPYLVTHAITDACGRTATSVQQVDCATAIGDHAQAASPSAQAIDGGVRFTGLSAGSVLQVFGPNGQLLVGPMMVKSGTLDINTAAAFVTWCCTSDRGERFTGKLVPLRP